VTLEQSWQSALDALAEAGLPARVASLAHRLLTSNADQWRLEDDSHAAADAPRSTALKRAIDASNERRAELIAAIDRTVVEEFDPPLYDLGDGLFRNSESVGRLLDRLSIAHLRQARLEEALVLDDSTRAVAEKLDEVRRQLPYQLCVLSAFVENLRRRTASYAPESNVKHYRVRRGAAG
jgi:hypothetical protein